MLSYCSGLVLKKPLNKFGSLNPFTYICPMTPSYYQYYTTDHSGVKTHIGFKLCKKPQRTKMWEGLRNQLNTDKAIKIIGYVGVDKRWLEDNTEIDLFAHYYLLPQEVQDVLAKYSDWGDSYDECRAMLKDMEAVGYTFEYYLDAVPYDLRKINLVVSN